MGSSDVIALCAVVIAVMSMIATFWQAWLTRKHNRLSVSPLIGLSTSFVKGRKVHLEISNRGLGPAIIQTVEFVLGDTSIVVNDYISYQKALKMYGVDILRIGHSVCALVEGSTISPGQSTLLLNFSDSDQRAEVHHELSKKLQTLKVKVKYKSIYGEPYQEILDQASQKS